MKSFNKFITEKEFVPTIVKKKKKWGVIKSTSDKTEFSDDLVRLVTTAYSVTTYGSFINSVKDVLPSDWVAIDIDSDPNIDAAIFYRKTKFGNKIQGLGHDGSRETKDIVLKYQMKLLNKSGWWVEASDAIEHIMYKNSVPFVSDESKAQKMFPGSELEMNGKRPGQYTRKLKGGTVITETIFGKPKV